MGLWTFLRAVRCAFAFSTRVKWLCRIFQAVRNKRRGSNERTIDFYLFRSVEKNCVMFLILTFMSSRSLSRQSVKIIHSKRYVAERLRALRAILDPETPQKTVTRVTHDPLDPDFYRDTPCMRRKTLN